MDQHGQVIEMELPIAGVCRCGCPVDPHVKVQFWRSAYGPMNDRILSCPACARPTAPVPERMWLMKQRAIVKDLRFGFMYGSVVSPDGSIAPSQMPMELEANWAYLEAELDANWRKINIIMMKLLDHLPRCEECSQYATKAVKNGLSYCDAHAGEHPNAQELPWAKELRELGVV